LNSHEPTSNGATTQHLRAALHPMNGDQKIWPLEYFAKHYLKIRPKAGGAVPFKFNPVQRKLHAIIEEQRAETGMVHIVVLKAVRKGVSIYVAGRYYHKTVKNPYASGEGPRLGRFREG
jgi:hypothetical protein